MHRKVYLNLHREESVHRSVLFYRKEKTRYQRRHFRYREFIRLTVNCADEEKIIPDTLFACNEF